MGPLSQSPRHSSRHAAALIALVAGVALGGGGARSAAGQQSPATVLVEAAAGESGLPLAGAQLRILELGRLAHGGTMGEAWFRHVPAGTYTIAARRIGYAPISTRVVVRDRPDTVEVTLFLRPAAQQLPEVTIEAAGVAGFNPGLREFARHEQRGFGRFMALPQLERDGTREIANVIFARVPGLRIVTSADHVHTYLFAVGWLGPLKAGQKGDAAPPPGTCPHPVQVYVDGVFQADPDISTITAADLAAVEFYDGIDTPVEYRRAGSECGVLVLWTRW